MALLMMCCLHLAYPLHDVLGHFLLIDNRAYSVLTLRPTRPHPELAAEVPQTPMPTATVYSGLPTKMRLSVSEIPLAISECRRKTVYILPPDATLVIVAYCSYQRKTVLLLLTREVLGCYRREQHLLFNDSSESAIRQVVGKQAPLDNPRSTIPRLPTKTWKRAAARESRNELETRLSFSPGRRWD
ncbi:hypothetical protein C8J56DRAFT_1050439 [Mycena floridula]|nr:hypothetical protein C8J56DRAFT_1050437 [Mycena floridula]KAJ7588365.1 hypothetical protein C8J56DRAFT_1050439 [Mycena floridula]